MAAGHARIKRVDALLANGEKIDFDAENQAMSDFVQEETQNC